ncbi:MAG: hypothetical protein ACE5LS_00630 [Thermoplasmata archaeon]
MPPTAAVIVQDLLRVLVGGEPVHFQEEVSHLPVAEPARLRVPESLRVHAHVEIGCVEDLELSPPVHEGPLREAVVPRDQAEGDGGLHLRLQPQEVAGVGARHRASPLCLSYPAG